MRNLSEQQERVESGAIRFGDDWPGLWLRGDDAFGLSLNIRTVVEYLNAKRDKENIPGELYLALLGLAGISDDIQKDVVVGGPICPLLTPALLQKREQT